MICWEYKRLGLCLELQWSLCKVELFWIEGIFRNRQYSTSDKFYTMFMDSLGLKNLSKLDRFLSYTESALKRVKWNRRNSIIKNVTKNSFLLKIIDFNMFKRILKITNQFGMRSFIRLGKIQTKNLFFFSQVKMRDYQYSSYLIHFYAKTLVIGQWVKTAFSLIFLTNKNIYILLFRIWSFWFWNHKKLLNCNDNLKHCPCERSIPTYSMVKNFKLHNVKYQVG